MSKEGVLEGRGGKVDLEGPWQRILHVGLTPGLYGTPQVCSQLLGVESCLEPVA